MKLIEKQKQKIRRA